MVGLRNLLVRRSLPEQNSYVLEWRVVGQVNVEEHKTRMP